MYCPECGAKNEAESLFCGVCGIPLYGKSDNSPETPVQKPTKGENVAKMAIPVTKGMPDNEGNPITMNPPIRKGTKIILVEVIILIVLLIGCSSYAKKLFGPEFFANAYFKALSDGDMNTVYRNLDVEESQFLSSDMFQKYADMWEDSDVTNYKVTCQYNSSLKENYVTANIIYRTKDAEDDLSYSIPLEKQKDKKYFLFDSWKVQSNSLIVNEYSIFVPTGATVTVGGIVLEDSYIKQPENEMGQTEYCINGIFKGIYDIKVTKAGMEDYSGLLYVEMDEDIFSLEDMNYTDETIQTVQKQAGEFVRNCLQALAGKNTFSAIQSFVSIDKETAGNVQDAYDIMLDNRDYIIHMKQLNVYDITSVVTDIQLDEICLIVDYTYDQKYIEKDWWSGDQEENTSDNLAGSMFVRYKQENGNWVVSYLDEY